MPSTGHTKITPPGEMCCGTPPKLWIVFDETGSYKLRSNAKRLANCLDGWQLPRSISNPQSQRFIAFGVIRSEHDRRPTPSNHRGGAALSAALRHDQRGASLRLCVAGLGL